MGLIEGIIGLVGAGAIYGYGVSIGQNAYPALKDVCLTAIKQFKAWRESKKKENSK